MMRLCAALTRGRCSVPQCSTLTLLHRTMCDPRVKPARKVLSASVPIVSLASCWITGPALQDSHTWGSHHLHCTAMDHLEPSGISRSDRNMLHPRGCRSVHDCATYSRAESAAGAAHAGHRLGGARVRGRAARHVPAPAQPGAGTRRGAAGGHAGEVTQTLTLSCMVDA